jgi:hypothetical protein
MASLPYNTSSVGSSTDAAGNAGSTTSTPNNGATRDPSTIPFASDSVWNIGIGSNAIWSADGEPDAQQLHQLNGAIDTAAWGQPIYFGTASDPLVTVTDTDSLFPVPPQQIHIPIGAQPAAGSGGFTDAHMSFYDATQPGKLWSYWGASFNNGADVTGGITAGLGGVWDTTGDGVTNTVSPGSDYDYAAGVITDYDMSIGAIDHAVRIAISTDALKSPGANWTDNIPWPNTHEDYYGSQMYTGNIVAGSTFGIPASVDLNSLGLSAGGMMLAKALQQYGGIWRDSGGSNQATFYSTPNQANNPLIDQMQGDMAKIIPQLEIMRNQGPNSINGGGTPIVPPLPPVSLTGEPQPAPVVTPPTAATPSPAATLDGVINGGADTAQSGTLATTGANDPTVNDTTASAAHNTITIDGNDANPVVDQSDVTIAATSGDHMLFIGGTHDVAILSGGTESVQADQGYNSITTDQGDDTIRFGGSGNTINAGTGNNALYDSGSSNNIVMPGPGQGFDDIYGPILNNGDLLDLRTALDATAWDGSTSSLGSYLRVTTSGSDAIVSMTTNPGGAYSQVADLHDVGSTTLSTLLAHSIT